GNGGLCHAAKSRGLVRYAGLDRKRQRSRSRKDRSRAEQRAYIPAARRNCSRNARLVQVTPTRTPIEIARGSYARARSRSSRSVEEERNDEILMTNDDISSNVRMTNNSLGSFIPSSFDVRASSLM